MNTLKKIGNFEIRHRVLSFVLYFLLTIIISRVLIQLKDPNIFIKSFELHHFYFGMALLVLTSLLMLYKRIDFKVSLPLIAISIGLVVDEVMFISGKIRGPITYDSTILPTIFAAIIIILIVEMVFYSLSKK